MSNGRVLVFDGWWGWRRAQKIYFPILNFQGHFGWWKGFGWRLGRLGLQGWLSRKFSFQFYFSAGSAGWGWESRFKKSWPGEGLI